MARKIEVQIVGSSASLERAFSRAGSSARGFDSRTRAIGRNLARNFAAIGVATAGLGIVTGKAFSSFEETMDRVVGLAGGARESVDSMAKEILRLGPQVAKGPQELGEALYFVASAGIAVDKQMQVVNLSARASAAGLGQTQQVADAVTSAMNAYGPAVVNAARATDVLVNTVKFGKGEAASFAPVIGTVAALAAQLGVRFEEVGAALAAQTRLGVSAETAAIQLQATFSSLLKVTPKAAKALKSVGLSAEGLRKQLREKGLLAVLETLKASFGDNTAAMAEAFPNIRALRGLLSLLGANADSTREVFDGMKDSTGALGTAFDAVSKGEAFRFKQTLASLQATGIRLGAIFAPVARIIARGTTEALSVVNDFLDKLGEARTIRAKLAVVWEGVQDAAEGAQDLLGQAVRKIDFDKVFAEARGIADGLQKRLEEVDFTVVGKEIGDAITDAVRVAIPATKELAERINAAIRAIDFNALGRELGPALAAAVVTGFLALMDPVFWVKNWDLALAVGLTALGGPIGRIAGKIAPFFARLGASAVAAVAGAIERLSPRIASVLLAGLLRLPALAARALSPLTNVVSGVFGRLGRIAQFVVKVLGLTAAINAVVQFWRRVGQVFQNLGNTIKGAFSRAFDALKRWALRAAIEIIEPFTHIPGILGGGTFRRLQREWSANLAGMEQRARGATRTIQDSIDRLHGKEVDITIKTSHISDASDRAAPQAKTRSRKLSNATARAAEQAASAAQATAVSVSKSADSAEKASEKASKAFERLMDALRLKVDIAAGTKGLRDDIKAQDAIIAALKTQIEREGRTTELVSQLVQARRDRSDLIQQARTGKQFAALGLTETGEARIPSAGTLRKRLGAISEAVKGTFLDTGKTRTLLANIRKLLGGELGRLSDEVRAKIKELLDGLNQQLGEGVGQRAATKFKKSTRDLTEGLGLTPEQRRELRARLSRIGAGGTVGGRGIGAFGFAFPSGGAPTRGVGGGMTVNLYGDVVTPNADKFLSDLQNKARHRSASRRGSRRGKRTGTG